MTAKPLRYALIGVGANVYGMHHIGLELPHNEVVAVCDLREDAAQKVAEEWGCPYYLDYRQMIDETKPDVVVVMTPHTEHAPMAIYAMKAGAHALVEKPMAIHVAEADEMIRTAEETGKVLAINFQQRLRPEVAAAHDLIQEGVLGKIQHVDVKITWTRTARYYGMSDWRGTWDGAGGGLLMNQAPHDLDMICHLVGMPKRLYAWTPTIAHNIETEDTVQAMLMWENGALGTIHASTAEAGQPQRFEIIGTGGHLQINHGSLDLKRFDTDVEEFLRTSPQAFAQPELHDEAVELGTTEGNHRGVHLNLYEHLIEGKPLNADGLTGRMGLELANAMIYSHYTGEPVDLPLDRAKYAQLLEDLRAGRIGRKGN